MIMKVKKNERVKDERAGEKERGNEQIKQRKRKNEEQIEKSERDEAAPKYDK